MNVPCPYPCTYYIYNVPLNTAFVILGCTWIALRMPSETRWNWFFPTASFFWLFVFWFVPLGCSLLRSGLLLCQGIYPKTHRDFACLDKPVVKLQP